MTSRRSLLIGLLIAFGLPRLALAAAHKMTLYKTVTSPTGATLLWMAILANTGRDGVDHGQCAPIAAISTGDETRSILMPAAYSPMMGG
jgi:hypothetical protein